MKKAAVMLLAALSLAGCDRQAPDRSAPQEATLLGQEDAMTILARLPEVAAWANRVKSKSRGKALPVYKAERTPDDCRAAREQRLTWTFRCAESHPTATVFWNRFRVDAVSGEVRVWEPRDDSYMTLGRWRVGYRPP